MSTSPIFRPARLLLILAASAVLVGGFLLATTVFGGSSRTGLQIPIPNNPPPSGSLKLEPSDPAFDEFVANFSDFPIYWVGKEFGGHSLRRVSRLVFSPQDGGLSQNAVRFLYGSCAPEILNDGGCPFPLQIEISPYCQIPPELVGGGSRPDGMEKVRGGADAVESGGGLRIWTGDITIKIYADTPQLIEDATAAIVSPNGIGTETAGSPLPAPDPDCSGYRTAPLYENGS